MPVQSFTASEPNMSAVSISTSSWNNNNASKNNNSNNTSAAHERALRHLKKACEQIKRHQWFEKYETPIGHAEQRHDED